MGAAQLSARDAKAGGGRGDWTWRPWPGAGAVQADRSAAIRQVERQSSASASSSEMSGDQPYAPAPAALSLRIGIREPLRAGVVEVRQRPFLERLRGVLVARDRPLRVAGRRLVHPLDPSVEAQIVAALGGVYEPYTGRWFSGPRETDIEHIVARSEAHDSGLCAADPSLDLRGVGEPCSARRATPKPLRR